ncbi:MAG TPA: ChrR family anti-sigma-E factor [Microvirga sp.]|nr:ChrR family anti-sigma-E factor [Microvirga sp.]
MTDAAGQSSDRALERLLAGYVAGTLRPPLHVLVASHLALAPESRVLVRKLEAARGAALESAEPQPVSKRGEKLAAIFAAQRGDVSASEAQPDEVLPEPLARYLGASLGEIRWRTLVPGLKEHRVDTVGHGEAMLYWVRPGRKMLTHTHDGPEYTLVLKGGFRDIGGHYRRGDIAIAEPEIEHGPQADEDQDCICYTVSDAPLRLVGPVGRIVQWLSRRA